jgi:hypothetical protein
MDENLREILKQVRLIDIRTRRLATDALAGQFHSMFRGRGMDFEEVRPGRRGAHHRLERVGAGGPAVREEVP